MATPTELASLAKRQLGLSPATPDSVIPHSYIQELQNHVQLHQADTNFRVALEPGFGFGVVECLEDGCDEPIELIERVKVYDGGRSDGFGSLSAYRNHCQTHPTHAMSRFARLRKERQACMAPGSPYLAQAKQEAVAPTISAEQISAVASSFSHDMRITHDAYNNIVARLRGGNPDAVARSPSPFVKPELPELTIPYKRFADNAFHDVPGGYDLPEAPSTPKRLKKEPSLTSPLQASLLLNSPTQLDQTVVVTPTFSADTDSRSLSLTDIQHRISQIQRYCDALAWKNPPSATDRTNMSNYMLELNDLKKQKSKLQTPATAPVAFPSGVSSVFPQYNALTVPDWSSNPSFPDGTPIFQGMGFPQLQQPIATGSNVKLETQPAPFPGTFPIEDFKPAPSIMNHLNDYVPYLTPAANANSFDENGDFYGRGRDTFEGPIAAYDDINRFIKEASNAEQFDANATVQEGLEKLGLKHQNELLGGMNFTLMPHQIIGVAWMVEKEKTLKFSGGILADDMGLGKTVQMLATMCKNPPEDKKFKTTLILAPTALLDQWDMEVNLKTKMNWTVCIYHGSNKPKRKQDLLAYDVVITTYQTMAREWPDYEGEERKKKRKKRAKQKNGDDFIVTDSDDDGPGGKKSRAKQSLGLLFQCEFYRIILDEAQNIRNKRTRVSRAVTDLTSKYRWCLTGTPIVNTLIDVYAYFRFLRISPWHDWKEFNSFIGLKEKKNPTLATTRLQNIFACCLLRRLKDSKLDGKRLIDLPPKQIDMDKLEFSEEERVIYNQVEAKSQVQFNRYLRAGTVLKNYHHVLVLLLRLRQVCSHPCLIQENGENLAFVDADNFQDLTPELASELTRAKRVVSAEFVAKVKARLKDAALRQKAAIKGETDAMDTEGDEEEDLCPVCLDVYTDPTITACEHTFCRECINNVLDEPLRDDEHNGRADERPCPSCRTLISPDMLFNRNAFEPSEAEFNPVKEDIDSDTEMAAPSMTTGDKANPIVVDSDSEEENEKSRSKDLKGKGRARFQRKTAKNDLFVGDSEGDYNNEDEDDDLSDFIVHDDEDEEEKDVKRDVKKKLGRRKKVVVLDSDEEYGSLEEKEVLFGVKKFKTSAGDTIDANAPIPTMDRFLPSTKMKYMMEHIRKLQNEKPEEKIIVISQWTSCLSLVSHYLSENDIPHVKYQGDMNRVKRDAAVRVFMDKEKARIMLMSQKCGGVGLNLTRANNVISLDLGWSPAVENQAFDRVHRLGQRQPVLVKRLVISETVENRILALQERKQILADGSLGEGTTKKMGRLNVSQLAELFGLDTRGRPLR